MCKRILHGWTGSKPMPTSQFTLVFPMDGFQTIQTLKAVPSGSEASVVWQNLNPATPHEWNVTVTNSMGKR